jgi:hypothetical protein
MHVLFFNIKADKAPGLFPRWRNCRIGYREAFLRATVVCVCVCVCVWAWVCIVSNEQ